MLYLRTLGGIALLGSDGQVITNQKRRLALLALLSIAGERGMTRDKIVAYLWPESSGEKARHSLDQVLYSVRRHAGEEVFLGTDPLRLNPDAVGSDVGAFEKAVAQATPELAVALYSGVFLDGFFLNGVQEFDDWVDGERARLARAYTSALYRVARTADEQQQHTVAIERWRSLSDVDALDPRATLGLMRALVAAGDPGGALRHARNYEKLVRQELDNAPAPDVVAYVDELKTQAFVTPPQTLSFAAGPHSSDDGASETTHAFAGRYRLEQQLGRGGMATVFLAYDLQHKRRIALKLVHQEQTSELGLQRFLHEIQLTAQLQHPHILPVFDSGETDGRLWFTTPWIDGESLRARLRRAGRLPVDLALSIARQVASALEYAQRRGIVHRDVKPENILLQDGVALLADFGIAKLMAAANDEQLTEPGFSMGTPRYMSPEHARGSEVDGRSDIFSLGCVLYEMLSGEPHLAGMDHATNGEGAVLTTLSGLRPPIPENVVAAIARALRFDPTARFNSPEEFSAALSSASVQVEPHLHQESARPKAETKSKWLSPRRVAASATALIVLTMAGGYAAWHWQAPPAPAGTLANAAAPAVAILPFGVNDPALQTWRNGALVLLATDIDGVAGLRAIDPQTILAALPQTRGESRAIASAPDHAFTMKVARQTEARYALTGNAVVIGATVRLSADLYRTENGRRLRHFQFEGPPARMFALMDALAIDVLRTLLHEEDMEVDASRLDLARRKTTSLTALRAYLEGEEHSHQSRFTEAAESYARAFEADTMFALVLARFLVPYSFLQPPPTIPDALARALRMIDRLPRREALLVRAGQEFARSGVAAGFALLRQASREYPDDSEVWYSLGEVAFHQGGALLLQADVPLEAFRKSAQLNPAFGAPYYHLVELLIGQRADSAAAAEAIAAYERHMPEGEHRQALELAFALAFENAAARNQALAALDTSSFGLIEEVTGFVAHPRQRAAQERALALLTTRLGKSVTRNPNFGPAAGGRTFLYGGQLSAAITATLKLDACPELEIYWAYMFGKSQLPAEADAALRSRAPASPGCAMGPFLAGAYTADQGPRGRLEEVRTILLASADSALSVGDTGLARATRLQAEALRAYALARAGKLEPAIQILEAIQPRLPMNTNKIVRWWLGNLLLQANRPLEARRYFQSFWDWQHGHPIAASYYLGRIDEQLGQRADARARYTHFASAWRNADREIQPRITDARARIALLGQ